MEMMPDKEMTKAVYDSQYLSDGVSFLKWTDTKPVHGSETTTVNRKKKDGSSVAVKCPISLSDYNKHMGGVVHADRLRALYRYLT